MKVIYTGETEAGNMVAVIQDRPGSAYEVTVCPFISTCVVLHGTLVQEPYPHVAFSSVTGTGFSRSFCFNEPWTEVFTRVLTAPALFLLEIRL